MSELVPMRAPGTTRIRTAIYLVLATALLAGPASALATFPGEPGQIAFHRFPSFDQELRAQIFAVEPGGGKISRLTSLLIGSFAPDFSPDGSRIAFEQKASKKAPHAIWTMNADGSQPTRLTFGCGEPRCLGDDAPAWTPGGEILFQRGFGPVKGEFARGIDLMIMKADGSEQRVLRRFLKKRDGREPIHDAQVSPDGRTLAITLRNTTAKPKLGSSIFLLDADGTKLRRITPPRLNAGNPDWSPDGRRIVFNSSFEGQGAANLYSVRPDGRGLRLVYRARRGQAAFDPVWSPDGERIACIRFTGGRGTHVWTMKPNGTGLRRLSRGPGLAWRLDWGARP